MARQRKQPDDQGDNITEDDMRVLVTPNQVVAYNLWLARTWKNWTQAEAAEQLAPYLGKKWSKASFSAAERSVDGERVRNFTADEIVAFSRAFGLPVGFFFLPPASSAAELPIRVAAPDKGPWGIPTAELIDIAFGDPGEAGYLGMRIEEFFRQESTELQTEAQRRLSRQTEMVVEAIVKRDLGRFSRWQTMLTQLVQQLEDWQRRAGRIATGDEEIPSD